MKFTMGSFLPLLACLLLFVGCQKGPSVVPVSGRVTLDGKPVAQLTVVFVPLANEGKTYAGAIFSTGETDNDGHYSLEMANPRKRGAIVGEHSVRIAPPGPAFGHHEPAPPAPTVVLPPQADDGSIHFPVPPEGTDKADFPLTSTPAGR